MAEKYYGISPYAIWANNPMRFVDPDGRDWLDKVAGWTYGMIDNMTGSHLRASYTPTHSYDYNNSLNAADATSLGLGMVSVLQGSTMAGSGLLAAPATGGTSLIGSAVGVGVAAEGAYMATNAVNNLGEGNHYGEQPRETTNRGNGHLQGGDKIPDSQIQEAPAKRGNAPTGSDGNPIELHHRDQNPNGPIDEMTRTDHRSGNNYKKNHTNTGQSRSLIDRNNFQKQREEHWKKEWDSGRFNKQ